MYSIQKSVITSIWISNTKSNLRLIYFNKNNIYTKEEVKAPILYFDIFEEYINFWINLLP